MSKEMPKSIEQQIAELKQQIKNLESSINTNTQMIQKAITPGSKGFYERIQGNVESQIKSLKKLKADLAKLESQQNSQQ